MEYSDLLLSGLLTGAILVHLRGLFKANKAAETHHVVNTYRELAADAIFSTAKAAAEFAEGTGELPPFERLADDSLVAFNGLINDFGMKTLDKASAMNLLRATAFQVFTPPSKEEASADRRGTEA